MFVFWCCEGVLSPRLKKVSRAVSAIDRDLLGDRACAIVLRGFGGSFGEDSAEWIDVPRP